MFYLSSLFTFACMLASLLFLWLADIVIVIAIVLVVLFFIIIISIVAWLHGCSR